MRARVLHSFFDLKAKVSREEGGEFEATAARIREINAAGVRQGVGQLVEGIEEKKPAKPPRGEGGVADGAVGRHQGGGARLA